MYFFRTLLALYTLGTLSLFIYFGGIAILKLDLINCITIC